MTHDTASQTDHNLPARADLCRFLSACYYEPSPAVTEEGVFDSMMAVAAGISPALADEARRLGEAFASADPQALLVDYTRLFLGPVRALAMPYGSMWLPGDATLMQDSTMAVRELYAQGGFDVGEDFADLPDHVAVELEFLYLLLFNAWKAGREGDTAVVHAANALRTQFLRQHLGAWMDAFAAAVTAHAETAFYRQLAGLSQQVIGREKQLLAPVQ